MKLVVQWTKGMWGWNTELLPQTMKSVFKVDWHSPHFASLSKQQKRKALLPTPNHSSVQKNTNKTKELLNRTSPFENAARREYKTTLSAAVFVPVPVTWRCLSSDSVKRNRQSTRDYVCECKTVQEISTSTLAIYLKRFSFAVTLPEEARSTSKSIPWVFKSYFVD